MIVIELKNRVVWDALKEFVAYDVNCEIIDKKKKVVGFDTVIKFTTLKCGNVTLKFEEGLGIFDALISVGDIDVLYFRYWPNYGIVSTIAMYKKDEKWKDLVTVTKDSFDETFLAYDIAEALARKISLKQVYDKIEEIEKKFLEELWPKQKIAYTAWVYHAFEKLGMTAELKEQKTT